MRALVLDGDWDPRPGYRLTREELEGRWAREARRVWRNPVWSLREVAMPRLQSPQDVLIRVRAAGIAVSTLRMTTIDEDGYVILPYRMGLPVIPGHEFSGEVVEVGAEVVGLAVGDPVAVESLRPCGSCAACLAGRLNACQVGGFAGFTEAGGLAEYAVVPASRARSLAPLRRLFGESDIYELGVLCESAAVAFVALFHTDGHLRPGMSVAVFGAGPLGQAAIALARCAGAATVLAFDVNVDRLEIAAEIGADAAWPNGGPGGGGPARVVLDATRGRGADVVIDTTGDAAAVLPQIQSLLAVGGHVIQLGVGGPAAPLSTITSMVQAAVHTFSMGHLGGFEPVIELLANGRLDLRPMIGRRWALEDVLEALADPATRNGAKALVLP